MTEHTTTECLLFPDIFDRPVVAKFDQRQGSSDGGAILLQAAERRLGLTSALAACLGDDRQPGKVQHGLRELITQRVMAIALGYEDANDAARLACDPIHKLLVGRDPLDGEDLASQPTLSRFENAPDRKELLRMTEALADRVIERHRKRLHGRARRITIDLDPTEDPTHGAQQLSFFNRHYDSHCYLPMVCFLTFNDEAEQYLVAAVLRPGNAPGSAGAIGILRRLIGRVGNAFPKARIRVRLDGGFASPEVLDFLDCEPKVEYLVNLAANAVLKRKAESAMKRARRASEILGQTEHVYGECRYATRKTWPWKRRVIYKAEVVRAEGKEPKDNPRFVVTNLKQSPQWIYERVYCQRGDVGVSSQGHINQSVKVRPRLEDPGLVAWEAPWRISKTAKPSDNILGKEDAQRTRLQRTVNADVASLHGNPVAETVDNVRKQQELAEMSPMQQLSPAGYQRRHGVKADVSTGEALDARRRNLAGEALAITLSGKCERRHQGDGSGRTTVDRRAVKHVWREGPGPVSTPFVKVRQG